MRKFNVRQIEAFRAVVTLGSMSRAAELLGVSQPAVSRLLSDFQEAVGFKLFRRMRNGTEATKDARHLFEQVEKLFIGLEELNQQVAAIKSLKIGRLTLVMTSSYISGILPDLVAAFRAEHPDIDISLKILSHEQVVDWVSSGAAEIGFTTQFNGTTALETEPLLRAPLACVLPCDHRLAGRDRLALEDLRGESFISFPRGTPFRFEIDMLFDRAGVERDITLDAASHDAVCALVACGLGVAMVNPFSPHVGRAGQVVFRPVFPSIDLELQIIWNEASETAASARFREFAAAYLQSNPPALF